MRRLQNSRGYGARNHKIEPFCVGRELDGVTKAKKRIGTVIAVAALAGCGGPPEAPGYVIETSSDITIRDDVIYLEDDMVMGTVSDLLQGHQTTTAMALRPSGLGRRDPCIDSSNCSVGGFRWPAQTIPYSIRASVNKGLKDRIEDAMAHVSAKTVLSFRFKRSTDPSWVEFVEDGTISGSGNSPVGMQPGATTIRLKGGASFGTVVHEIGHSVGLYHEHQRCDRSSYVAIRYGNISIRGPRLTTNFGSICGHHLIGNYDFDSIMHYGAYAFSKLPWLKTIETRNGESIGQRNGLSAGDINAINLLYRDRAVTAVATGDLNGNGLAEIVTGISSGLGERLVVFDRNGQLLASEGIDWGSDTYVTDVALGEFDGTPGLEIAVARYSTANARVMIYDFDGSLRLIFATGSLWPADVYPTSIATGDVDGFGNDELVVGLSETRANQPRWRLYGEGSAGIGEIQAGSYDRPAGAYATSVAIGAPQSAALGPALAVGYSGHVGPRYQVFRELLPVPRLHYSDGNAWGYGYSVTDLAFGDIDGDGLDELAVARDATTNARVIVHDDRNAGYAALRYLGSGWGTSYPTAVAFGDVDADGREELGVARYTIVSGLPRFVVIDDASTYGTLFEGGQGWGTNSYANDLVFAPELDSDAGAELVVGRTSGINDRYMLYQDAAQSFSFVLGGLDRLN